MADIVAGNTGHITEHNRLRKIPTAGVALESFDGASDDARLTAAMSYAAAQTHPPAIQLTNSSYSFTTARTLYSGFRLVGPGGMISNSELADANMQCKVTVSTSGTWLNVSGGDVFDAFVGNGLTFIGSSGTTFLGCDGSSIWHCSHLRDVSFHAFKSVLGTQSQKLLMTASLIDGWYQSQGSYNGAHHIGGSDNELWMNGALIDSSQAYLTSGGATGQYHFWFDGLDNTHIGRLYITMQGDWVGVRVSGSAYNAGGPPSNLGMVYMENPTIEGVNSSNASSGCALRVEGGIVKVQGGYLGRCMTNPSVEGHSPADAGTVHVTGGALLLDGATYDRASGQAETVPFVYVAGGKVYVKNTFAASKGGTWTGLPQVEAVGGTVTIDNTVSKHASSTVSLSIPTYTTV